MTRPVTARIKENQRRSNSLSLLKDMPNTVGALQWARETMKELSITYFSAAMDVEADTNVPKEEKLTIKLKCINLATMALKDMVAVCSTLLPYQSPKLSAVDVRHTSNKVVTIVEDMRRLMLLPAGSDIGKLPKILTQEEQEADATIEVDAIEVEEGELVNE